MVRRVLPLLLVVAGLAARHRLLRWGATPEELAAHYPAVEIVPGGRRTSVMAITIEAPPSAVWPWLVQMGCDRGGFYSWDRLDNGGRPSTERLHPEWQSLQQGDRVICTTDGSAWFDVALLDPERVLVLRSSHEIPSGRWFDPAGPLPRAYMLSTWGFFLRPTADGTGTRVVVIGAGHGRPDAVQTLLNWVFFDPAHWIMQTKQFRELARRAEATPYA